MDRRLLTWTLGIALAAAAWTALVMTGALDQLDRFSSPLLVTSPFLPTLRWTADVLAPVWVYLASVVVVTALARPQRVRTSVAIGLGAGLAWLAESRAKVFFGRPRPADALDVELTFAYPSGHATAAGFLVAALWLVSARLRPLPRRLLRAVALGVAAIIVADRWLLRVHWVTDLVGGVLLGAACALVALLVVSRRQG